MQLKAKYDFNERISKNPLKRGKSGIYLNSQNNMIGTERPNTIAHGIFFSFLNFFKDDICS